MSRPIAPTAEGFLLRPGRLYRMLIIVTGKTTCEDVEDAMRAAGFAAVASSAPQDWEAEKIGDWPDEPSVPVMPGETLVRAVGPFAGISGVPSLFEPHRPIAGTPNATYTLCAVWDHAQARSAAAGESTGASSSSSSSSPATEKKEGPNKVLILGLLGTAAAGVWMLRRDSKKEDDIRESMARLEQKREQGELEERVAAFISRGATREQAEELADRAGAAAAARRMADALERGEV